MTSNYFKQSQNTLIIHFNKRVFAGHFRSLFFVFRFRYTSCLELILLLTFSPHAYLRGHIASAQPRGDLPLLRGLHDNLQFLSLDLQISLQFRTNRVDVRLVASLHDSLQVSTQPFVEPLELGRSACDHDVAVERTTHVHRTAHDRLVHEVGQRRVVLRIHDLRVEEELRSEELLVAHVDRVGLGLTALSSLPDAFWDSRLCTS